MQFLPTDYLVHPSPLLYILGLSTPETSSTLPLNSNDSNPDILDLDPPALHSTETIPNNPSTLTTTTPDNLHPIESLSPTTVPPTLSVTPSDPVILPTSIQHSLSEIITKEVAFLPPNSVFPDLSLDPSQAYKERFHCVFLDPSTSSSSSIPSHEHQPHSALSPLTPGSSVYPDGLLSLEWYEQYQHQIPCIVIYFAMISLLHPKQQYEVTDTLLASTVAEHRKQLETKEGIKYFLCLVIEGTANVGMLHLSLNFYLFLYLFIYIFMYSVFFFFFFKDKIFFFFLLHSKT